MEAKKSGDFMSALEYHSQAAKLYRENAMAIRDQNGEVIPTLSLYLVLYDIFLTVFV